MGQFAVVREEQKAFGVLVQATDGENPSGQVRIKQAVDGGVGAVFRGRDHTRRFVHHQVEVFAVFHILSGNGDELRVGIDMHARIVCRLPVNGDQAFLNQLFDLFSRAESRCGKNLVQTRFGHAPCFLSVRVCSFTLKQMDGPCNPCCHGFRQQGPCQLT